MTFLVVLSLFLRDLNCDGVRSFVRLFVYLCVSQVYFHSRLLSVGRSILAFYHCIVLLLLIRRPEEEEAKTVEWDRSSHFNNLTTKTNEEH